VKRLALLGHPVGHSLSPALFGAACAELGVEASYEAIDVPLREAFEAQAARVTRGELAGCNVTLPHKVLALRLAAEPTPNAVEVGAANVLFRTADGALGADNTDVGALVQLLAPRAIRRAAVLGAGGAALAAVVAARRAGALDVLAWSRGFEERGRADARWAALERAGATVAAFDARAWAHGAVDVLVQATSAGMVGGPAPDWVLARAPLHHVRAGGLALDLVYRPARTPFVEAAARRGLEAKGGLDMLVLQASLSFDRWLGEPLGFVPGSARDAMERAARRALRQGAPA
jgi:shikimate dehydrogenase